MIVQSHSPNRTIIDKHFEVKLLEVAELVNFYSTLFIMAFGVTMNILIIYMLNSRPRAQFKPGSRLSGRNRSGVTLRSLSSSELYMCALAIVDTLFLVSYLMLNSAPSRVNTSDIYQMIHESLLACKFANYLRYSSRFCSSNFLVFFTYERFMAVRRPLERIKSSKSRLMTKIFIATVVTISVTINSYSIVLFELEKEAGQNRSNCVINVDKKVLRNLHPPFQFAISFVAPIILVCFFNTLNIRVLLSRKNQSLREPTRSDIERSGGDSINQRTSLNYYSNRATNTLILISVCFVGLNLPFVIARSWTISNPSLISVAVQCFAEILHVFNFAISFVIYFVASKRFREEFVARFLPARASTRSRI